MLKIIAITLLLVLSSCGGKVTNPVQEIPPGNIIEEPHPVIIPPSHADTL